MSGTSAGASKGWKNRKPSPKVATRYSNEQRVAFLREVNALRSGDHPSGININLRTIDEEYVQALKNLSDRIHLYDRMANDPDVKSVLRGNIYPLLSAVRWKVEGGDPEHRALVSANLLRQGPRQFWCDSTWNHRLFETLQCLKYGFAAFGKTREIVDGKMIFRRLTWLHPRSFKGTPGPWEWDKTGTQIVAAHRTYRLPDGKQETDVRIPIEDLFLSVWEMTGENWEGVSMIRSAYKSWSMKENSEKIGMIHLLNVGVGIPMGELAAGDGVKDRDNLRSIVESLRQGSKERAYIVKGPGQKVEFLTSSAATDLSSPLVNLHRQGIGATGSMQFLGMGNEESGSRASDSVHMVHYLQMADAVREIIQEQINHGAGYLQGLVEELVHENFGDVEECPRIVGSRVSPTEQLDNVPLIAESIQRGAITLDLSVENHIRKSLGIKELTKAEFEKAQAGKRLIPNVTGRPNEVGDADRQDPRDDREGRRFGLTEKKTSLPGESLPMRREPSWPWRKLTTA